jgi:hypothetical protein
MAQERFMSEIQKKEPGRADVEHRERGDPRQQENPIDRHHDAGRIKSGGTQDRPPARNDRGDESPWMGGG